MLQIIKDWYNLYGTLGNFLIHKVTHVIVGALLGLTSHFSLVIAIILVLVAAIGKEIADHIKSGETDAPLSAHVLDVIVTCLGGVIGILIGLHI